MTTPADQKFTVLLSKEGAEAIRQHAQRLGMTTSQLVRQCVDAQLPHLGRLQTLTDLRKAKS